MYVLKFIKRKFQALINPAIKKKLQYSLEDETNAAVCKELITESNNTTDSFIGPIPCLQEGEAGYQLLRKTFIDIITILKPSIFCDIGANDGNTAIEVKNIDKEIKVYGFEANPYIYSENRKKNIDLEIRWFNIAITDSVGPIKIYVPRTLSRAYVNGELVEMQISESENTGKSSLLIRNEEATYDNYEVGGYTLDGFIEKENVLIAENRFCLWIDVEGAADKVINGAKKILERTQAIFIETENYSFWKDQKKSDYIIEILLKNNFIPVARDREYSDKQFNILFVKDTEYYKIFTYLNDPSSPINSLKESGFRMTGITSKTELENNKKTYTSVQGLFQSQIPIIVPCFNNPTYVKSIYTQIIKKGFEKIIFIDNKSTCENMKSWLKDLDSQFEVVWLERNYGPRHIITNPEILSLLPRRFCLTDPDLEFNPFLPEGFLGDLSILCEKFKIGKVGFALNISDKHKMSDKKYRIGANEYYIWEWEEQFWGQQIDRTIGWDPVYKANIDTTFALYDKEYFDPDNYLQALRVAGRFTARHLPWYKEKNLSEYENNFYIKTQKFSFYNVE